MAPAARVLDLTTHGGVITGPGCPNVLIGGMPAARVGDPTICVGPTGTVAPPGCPNVLIGS